MIAEGQIARADQFPNEGKIQSVLDVTVEVVSWSEVVEHHIA